MRPSELKRKLFKGAELAFIAASLLIATRVAAGGSSDADDLSVAAADSGFLTSWLQLGPLQQPDGFKKDIEALANRDPLGVEKMETHPKVGDRCGGARWEARFSSSSYVKLSGKRPSLAYLAAVIRVPAERRIWLSTGSDDGIEVWLNGRALLTRFVRRRAVADSDLTRLDLVPGDNLVVLKLLKSDKGPWRLFARLFDGGFEPLTGAEIILPGAKRDLPGGLRKSSKLKVERRLDLEAGAVDVGVRVEFPGGRPAEGQVEYKLIFAGQGSPEARSGSIDLSGAGSRDVELGRFRFDGAVAPSMARVEIGGAELKESLGFRMQDAAGLAVAFADLKASKNKSELPRTSLESAAWRVENLRRLIEAGDPDYGYLAREIKDTRAIAAALAEGKDPYRDRRGEIQRRGYLSALDGSYQHYALYVPWGWKEEGEDSFGLLVSLHGLNGLPMNNMLAVFGENGEEGETKLHKERNPRRVGSSPFFVLSPGAFGNSGYRAFGEVDVLEAVDRVRERYRIDPNRIYITGLSMGGIGSASIPLHLPGLFAAASPLCGYHNLFIYSSLREAKLKPWEEFLASFRSNKDWALNGRHLPLYVVHGLKDNPRQSDALIDNYKKFGYEYKYENPNLGHHVWEQTYEKRRIFSHFAKFKRAAHPQRVTFTSSRLRYRSSGWIDIDEAVDYSKWSTVDAEWGAENEIKITTENVGAVTVHNDAELRSDGAISIFIDGTKFEVSRDDVEWRFHLEGGSWKSGPAPECKGYCKRPGLAGPLDDAFYEPLLFVYGTGDPGEEALARRLIGELKEPMSGATIDWPVKKDVEVTDEDLRKHSLVIVGTARNHALLSRIADKLPIRAREGALEVGAEKFEGAAVAASFIFPNPLNPKRYVVVHTGASKEALFYVAHLPELVPDYVIYDASKWQRKGGRVLGDDRDVLKAGFFDANWGL